MHLRVGEAERFHFLPHAPDLDAIEHQICGRVVAQRAHEIRHVPEPQRERRAEILQLPGTAHLVDVGEYDGIVERELFLLSQVEQRHENRHFDQRGRGEGLVATLLEMLAGLEVGDAVADHTVMSRRETVERATQPG